MLCECKHDGNKGSWRDTNVLKRLEVSLTKASASAAGEGPCCWHGLGRRWCKAAPKSRTGRHCCWIGTKCANNLHM